MPARRGPDDTLPHLEAPDSVVWETTLRCNMRCRHCGSTAGDARPSELDTRGVLEVCRQLIELGVSRVNLSGGETLLRPDWRELVTALFDGGREVALLTNGWVFTDRLLKELVGVGRGRLQIAVSLDGAPAVHDSIRALDGSFERAFRGAQALKAAGLPVAVITTVNRANLDSLPALREKVLDELKPYGWQVQVTSPFGRAREHGDMGLDHVEYARAAVFIAETRRLARAAGAATDVCPGDCVGYLSTIEGSLRDEPWTGCHAGLEILGILSNGDVKGCLSIIDDRFIEGNALRDGLAAIWNRAGAFAYARRFRESDLRGACDGCSVGAQCRGGCSANAISVNGVPGHAPFCLRAVETAADTRPPPGRRRRSRSKPQRGV